jgi:hypothetical protein
VFRSVRLVEHVAELRLTFTVGFRGRLAGRVRGGGGENVKRNERHENTPRLDIRPFVCKGRAKRGSANASKINVLRDAAAAGTAFLEVTGGKNCRPANTLHRPGRFL